ncbi:MAG: sporulation protein [Bacillus sp. (in: firmicutes)]
MLKRLLAAIGKGASKVDLQLSAHEFQPGELIKGNILITGGDVNQNIQSLDVRLLMNLQLKGGSTTTELINIPILEEDTIYAGEKRELPFHYRIPDNIGFSRNTVSYYFLTTLDVENGVNRKDIDKIIISPPLMIQLFFDSLIEIGFQERLDSGKIDLKGQYFRFTPGDSSSSPLESIQCRVAKEGNGMRAWIETVFKPEPKTAARCELTFSETERHDKQAISSKALQLIDQMIAFPHRFSAPFNYFTHVHEGKVSKLKSALSGMAGGFSVFLLGDLLAEENDWPTESSE